MKAKKKPAAVSIEDLRKRLRKGPVKFSFQKRDGSLREAVGTLDLEIVPESERPKTGAKASGALSFYDLEKGAWRGIAVGMPVYL